MPPFMYRCPNTGCRVQGFVDDEARKDSDVGDYLTTLCVMCPQVHLVNPSTGEVLGEESDD